MIKYKKEWHCDVPNCEVSEVAEYDFTKRSMLPVGWVQVNAVLYCPECAEKLGLMAHGDESAGTYADAPTTP